MASSAHDLLSSAGALWCLRFGCVAVMTEIEIAYCGIADAIGFGITQGKQRGVLIEAKVSRSDFKADLRKRHRDPRWYGDGKYGISDRYYIAPDGLLTVDEIPDPWGLLVVGAGDEYPRIVKRCRYTEPDPGWWAHHFATVAKILCGRWALSELGTNHRLIPDVTIPGMPDALARALAPLRHTQALYSPKSAERFDHRNDPSCAGCLFRDDPTWCGVQCRERP